MAMRGASGIKGIFFSVFFLFFLTPLFAQSSASGIPDAKKILLISPFNLSFAQHYQQVASYLEVLSHSGVSYLLTQVEIDTLNQSRGQSEAVREEFSAILPKLRSGEFDVVVTFGENAYSLIREHIGEFPSKTAIVFCGQDIPGKDEILSHSNTVGVFQRVDPDENIRLARQLFPKKKKLLLLTNWTSVGKRVKAQAESYMRQNPGLELLLVDNETTTTEEMFSIVSKLGPNAMILFYGWYNRRMVNFASLEYLMHRLGNRPDLPVFVMFDSMLRFSVLGGYVEQGKLMGMEAAEKTIRILRGEKTSSMEDTYIPQSLFLNWTMLNYYRVPKSLIPGNAAILGQPPSFWDRHREIIVLILIYSVLLSLFTILLVIFFQNNRKVSARMKAIFSHLPMRMSISDSKGKVYFEYSENREDGPAGKFFSPNEFPPELHDTFMKTMEQVLRTGTPLSLEYIAENRHRRADFVKVPPKVFGTDTVMWASTDIEDIHRAKDRVEDLMTRFKLTLDSVGDGVISAEEDGTILFANPVAEYMTGAAPGELIGKNVSRCVRLVNAEDDSPLFFSSPSSSFPAGPETDVILVSRNGSRFHVEAKSAPLKKADGSSSGTVTVIRNVTAEHHLNFRLSGYAEQQKILNSILEKIVLNVEDDTDATRLVMRTFCEHMRADRCCFHQYDERQNRMLTLLEYSSAEKQFVAPTLTAVMLPEDDPWLEKLKNHECFVVPDYEDFLRKTKADFEFDSMPERKIHSFYVAGIFDGPRLWGDISLVYERKKSVVTEQNMPFLQGVSHMLEILQERRKRRALLERSEYEKILILDNIRIPIFFFGADYHLICANHAAETIMNESTEELSCKCLKDHCGPDCPADCPIRLAYQDQKQHVKEMVIAGREYQLFASPILVQEQLAYVLANLIDMTDFNNSQRRLTSALLEAQNASRAKSLFLATVSHELRTPLNAVIGLSDLLKQKRFPPSEEEEYLDSIHTAGHTLLDLIDEILDFSRIEADQVVISPRETNLSASAAGIQALFRQRAEEKGLSMAFVIPPEMPTLIIDDFRLRQILMNLVGNAVKFTDRGQIQVSFDFVPKTDSEGAFSVAVKDTGIGVREDCRKTIFEPFVQQDTVRDVHLYKGRDLGLAISRSLARKMGGDITLESTPGEGSVFTLSFSGIPFRKKKAPVEQSLQESAPGVFPGVKALLVDDVPLNLKVLSAMLKTMKIDAVSAQSGEEALEILKKDIPDFVLTDMWMPTINGTELARTIRENPACSHVRIISVTADVIADRTFDMKVFDDILLKPVTLEKLSALFGKFKKREVK